MASASEKKEVEEFINKNPEASFVTILLEFPELFTKLQKEGFKNLINSINGGSKILKAQQQIQKQKITQIVLDAKKNYEYECSEEMKKNNDERLEVLFSKSMGLGLFI